MRYGPWWVATRVAAGVVPIGVTAVGLWFAQASLTSPLTWVAAVLSAVVSGLNVLATSPRIMVRAASPHRVVDPSSVIASSLESPMEAALNEAVRAEVTAMKATSALRDGNSEEAGLAVRHVTDHVANIQHLLGRFDSRDRDEAAHNAGYRRVVREALQATERYIAASLLLLAGIAGIVGYHATSGVIEQFQAKTLNVNDTAQVITAVSALVTASMAGVAGILKAYALIVQARAAMIKAQLGLSPSEADAVETPESASS